MKGRIIKSLAGFYYIESQNKIYQTRARSVSSQNSDTLLSGYKVGETEFLTGQLIPSIKLIQRMKCRNPRWVGIGVCHRDLSKRQS